MADERLGGRGGVLVVREFWYGVYECVAETSCGWKETGVGTRAGVGDIVRAPGLGFGLEMWYWFGVPLYLIHCVVGACEVSGRSRSVSPEGSFVLDGRAN